VQRIGGIGHDLTELKQAEAHQRLLLSELQHRVRNTLAVIRAIARRTARSSTSIEDYASHLEGRIDAFARVQAAVTRNPSSGVDLATLIGEELRAYRGREGDSLLIEGPAVRLNAKAAETVALAIHELATNAVKYGALSAPSGRLEVEWRLLPENTPPALALDWRESGVEIAEGPVRRGFGTEVLLHMLAYELDATTTLDFLPQGLHCRIVLPTEGLLQEG
jgi:two-component system CheB/CheR fusion protein